MTDDSTEQEEPSGRLRKTIQKPGPILAVLIVVVSIIFLVFRSDQPDADPLPMSWFIIGAAIFGSIANQPYRTDDARKTHDVAGYLLWKSGVAIVFAMLLHLLFIAGLVKGPLFPDYVRGDDTFETMAKFVLVVDPKTYSDAAKIVVWSFLAGYSERFVPNLIAQLADKASKAANKKG